MPHPEYSDFTVPSDVQEEYRKLKLQKRVVKWADAHVYEAEPVDTAIADGEIPTTLSAEEQERLKQILWAKAEINGAKWKLNTRKLGEDLGATLTDLGIASGDMEAFNADMLAFLEEYGTEGYYDVETASDEAMQRLLKLLSIDGKPIGSLDTYDGNVVYVDSDSGEIIGRPASPHYSVLWQNHDGSGLFIFFKFPGAEEKIIEYGAEDFDISEEEFPNLRNKIFALQSTEGSELALANADDSDFTSFDTSDSGPSDYTYTTLEGEVDATGYQIIWNPEGSVYTYYLFIPDATSLADMQEIGFPEDKVAIMTISGNIA